MEWLAQNWFWILLLVLFIGMHLFGHGGHGGGGGGCGGGHGKHKPEKKDQNTTDKNTPSTHQH